MDTLCIPVQQDMNALRLAQIDDMASIFAGAVTTLVLDAELMALQIEPHLGPGTRQGWHFNLPCELRARLICSAWMSRSWTLQEAALAPSVMLQFQDHMVSMGNHPSTSRKPIYSERLVMEVARHHPLVRMSKPLHQGECNKNNCSLQANLNTTLFGDERNVTNVWNSLVGRTTTKSEDLPLIISNLLGLKTHHLVRYSDKFEPFEMIFRSVPIIPFSFFFNQVFVQDQQDQQHHWIPRAIGTELISDRNFVSVGTRFWEYHHQKHDYGQGLAVYTSGPIAYDQAFVHFHDTVNDTFFSLESLPVELKALTGRNADSEIELYIVLDHNHESSPELPSLRRGACFVTNPRTTKPAFAGLKLTYTATRSPAARSKSEILDLTFHQGLRVRLIDTPHDTVLAGTLQLTPVPTPSRLRGNFESLPDTNSTNESISARLGAFLKFRRRKVPRISQPVFTVRGGSVQLFFGAVLCITVAVYVALASTVLSKITPALLLLFLLLFVFIMGEYAFLLRVSREAIIQPLPSYQARWRLRSFEYVARERSRRTGTA